MTAAGINLCGYLRTESGVGAAARGYVEPLRAVPLAVSLRDLSDLQTNRSNDQTLAPETTKETYPINIVCADVELHYAILARLGETFFQDRYNIAIWAWELLRFPQRWHDRFAYYDEVWVATSFIANMLAPISPIPVIRIPPALTISGRASRQGGRERLGVAPDEFVFLFIFDFNSHFARKNPLAVIHAFQRAFSKTGRVRLVLKCVNAKSDPANFERLKDAAGSQVTIEEGYWSTPEMRDLLAACDAYVSLHRSEGTGLTISDAMALGKPVIATGWSGNMDFMSSFNSFPVDYHLVTIEENVGPYKAGEMWAEPNVDQAAELMRQAFNDRDEALRRGTLARREIEQRYSAAAIAKLIRERMHAIELRRRFADFQSDVIARYQRYKAVPDQIRETVRTYVSPNGRDIVLVVSKGDEALLKLPHCEAWHFPRQENGSYAGYYPADSAAAIAHLEELRRKGAGYVVFPNTAFWWLEHYRDFKIHLDTKHMLLTGDNSHCDCVVYALAKPD